MPVEIADARRRAFEMMQANKKVRLFNRDTGEFAHLSGSGKTKSVDSAWLGFLHQADRLLAADATGEFDGFATIDRNKFSGSDLMSAIREE